MKSIPDSHSKENIGGRGGILGKYGTISLRNSVLFAAVLVALYATAQQLLQDDPFHLTVFADISPMIANGLATVFLGWAGLFAKRRGRTDYAAWMVMAIAFVCWVLGDLLWGYYELYLQIEPFPSPADVPYLLFYPLFLIGILILPSASLRPKERVKMALDTSIIMITAVIIFWGFLIAPTIEAEAGGDRLTMVLAVAYPVMDLVLFFALVELLVKKISLSDRKPLLIMAASLVVIIITDLEFMRQSLQETYVSGGILDIGWVLGPILAALSGLAYIDSLQHGRPDSGAVSKDRYGQYTWPLYLPYVCAVGAFFLLIWSHDHSFPLSFFSLSLALGGIIGLVIARQIMALNENAQLYNESQIELAEKKLAEEEIKRLNEGLEQRVTERTSQLEIANKELQSEIVERKQAESALRESERRLSDIINFLPDPTLVIDRQGRVISWNRAIEDLTSIKAADILGKGDYEYAIPFYGVRRPVLIDLVLDRERGFSNKYSSLKLMDNGTLVGESYVNNLKGGAYLVGSAAALYDSQGNIFGAIESIRDITEQKKAEEDLRKAKEDAEEATRAKSKFLANMSHEIRTPMNAVIGMTGLLLQTDLQPEQRDYLETICNSGDALLSIINDILDFSKIDGGKLVLDSRPFDLIGCIEQSLDLVSVKGAEKGLEVSCIIEDGVPGWIMGDASRLRQVLVNLLGNAVKFTEKGDVVLKVDSSPEELGKRRLHFAVADTGIGIDREDMSKLFEHFSQVATPSCRNYGGTGLGLAISKRIVKLMGGDIWVESELGKGSTFHFTVVAEPAAMGESEVEASALQGKSVLVVDDRPTAREMLLKYLHSWGMIADEAAGSREVMDLLLHKRYDAVLLDSAIPGTDSLALARDIGERSGAPIILVTPVGCSLPRVEPMAGWITKPVKAHVLRRRLMDLLAQGQFGREKVAPKAELPEETQEVSNIIRILLAEDNPINQKVALSMLKKLGYRADVAANGLEVLEALKRQHYDIILMDVQMPEMDGLETTRRIRSMGIDICIIAMTAYAMEGDREKCLTEGMDEYISKPIRMEDLSKALDSCRQVV